MHCVLHIGIEKTGSTALQHFLHNNGKGLKRNGVHLCTSVGTPNNRSLPAAFMAEGRSDVFIQRLKLKNIGERRRWKKQLLKAFSKEVAQAKKKSDTFLISSEHFHSRLWAPAEVKDFYAFLRPMFDTITVICYLRRQDYLGLSRYSEIMRAGLVQSSPLPVAVQDGRGVIRAYYNFETLLERWSAAFGEENIQPRIYSKSDLLNGDIIDDFLSAAGLEIDNAERALGDNSNSALSAEAQLVILGVNRVLKEQGRTESDMLLRANLVRFLQNQAPGISRQPTSAEARAFYKIFESSNKRIAAKWFDRECLFDTDFTKVCE